MAGPILIHSFIHSAISIAPLQVSSTTQRRSRLQHGYYIRVSRRSAQATAGKGLAQGPYVAARAGVEPMTLRLKVIVSTKAPPRPTGATTSHKLHNCTHSIQRHELSDDSSFLTSSFDQSIT